MNIEIIPKTPEKEKIDAAVQVIDTALEKFKAHNFTISEAQWVIDRISLHCYENAKVDNVKRNECLLV